MKENDDTEKQQILSHSIAIANKFVRFSNITDILSVSDDLVLSLFSGFSAVRARVRMQMCVRVCGEYISDISTYIVVPFITKLGNDF